VNVLREEHECLRTWCVCVRECECKVCVRFSQVKCLANNERMNLRACCGRQGCAVFLSTGVSVHSFSTATDGKNLALLSLQGAELMRARGLRDAPCCCRQACVCTLSRRRQMGMHGAVLSARSHEGSPRVGGLDTHHYCRGEKGAHRRKR